MGPLFRASAYEGDCAVTESTKPEMQASNATRRVFLKLAGASSLGLLLAACGIAPTDTRAPALTATSTATITPTDTPKPTLAATSTAEPTQTATATQTAIPTPTPTNTPKPTPTPVRPLPTLYVDGPLLKRRDTGEVVRLKGVNISNWGYEQNVTFDAPNKQSLWTRGLRQSLTRIGQ